MSIHSRATSLALVTALFLACSSGVDGKYYNSETGEFAMELKDGEIHSMQGMPDADLTYEVRGDSLVIHPRDARPGEEFTLSIGKDGTLSAGMLGTLTKHRK